MLIVCTIKRAAGTHTKMPDDGSVYSFLPNEAGDHVADVTNFAHIQRLLAIPTYLPYGQAAQEELAEAEGTDNDMSEVEEAIAPELAVDLAAMTMEELQAEYHHRFGRAAPPLIKYETLLRKLAAERLKPGSEG